MLMQAYVFKLFDIVWVLSRASARFFSALTDANEMVEIFDEIVEVQDTKRPERCKIKNGGIEIKDITFNYEKNNELIFKYVVTVRKE